MQKLFFWIIGT